VADGVVLRHWRGELSPWRTALVVFLVAVFPGMEIASYIGKYIADGAARGQDSTLLACVMMPLVGMIFIWAGVGLMRRCWHTLRQPLEMMSLGPIKTIAFRDSSRKSLAGVFLLVSLGLIAEGPMIALMTISDVMNPPPVHHHQPPRRVRR